MNRILIRGDHAWLRHVPPRRRDIRRLSKKFWKKSKADEERAARAEILARGGKTDRKLAQALRRAEQVSQGPRTAALCWRAGDLPPESWTALGWKILV